ncbi:hypothetical protein PHBOTO_004963 [Pseudozyma hubeiensis]|nr:hypothetical protein PHBOTO_004963 [Pseudozyma hubeiensis]
MNCNAAVPFVYAYVLMRAACRRAGSKIADGNPLLSPIFDAIQEVAPLKVAFHVAKTLTSSLRLMLQLVQLLLREL